MKRFNLAIFAAIVAMFVLVGCAPGSISFTPIEPPREAAEAAQQEASATAVVSVPIPKVQYFHERATIARWTEHWDKPTRIPTYVYLFNYGVCIGYFVADGKPASIRSYLTPEETTVRADLGEYNGDIVVSAPALDGTYGNDNEGIRFFTSTGIPVEWGGSGSTYLYSDVPLGLQVPKLGQ